MSATKALEIHTRMGAILTDEGVTFRVWAPHAEAVSVIGSFNDWNEEAHRCEKEDGGNWHTHIPHAKPGDEYKYVITNGQQKLQRIDPRAREVTNSIGNGVITDSSFDWQGDQFLMPAWNGCVIYEMHIGTFHRKGEAVGSFDSAIEKLPYLKELGINAVELMPLAEFAGDYSWGYNPAHPYAIETAYGGSVGLKRLVREAHRHGIAVIVDVVYNHFGPSDLHLWQFDGWSENGKGGIYFYNDWRSTTPWGDTRPDYGRGEVRQYIFDNAMMWLEDYHADGLRYDMTIYMRSVDGDESRSIPEGFSLAQWINSEIHQRYPDKITIAEDLRDNPILTLDREQGGAQFSAQWDAQFVHPIRRAIIEIDDQNRSMQQVAASIQYRYNVDAFERIIYTESHDEVANGKQRVVSEIDRGAPQSRYAIKRSTLGAALMFTSPGIPMLFQGQEFLVDKWFDDGRPINWKQADEFQGLIQMYRDLISLRLNRNGQSAGLGGQHVDVYHLNDSDKLVAMRRWKEGGPGDDVIAIFKFAEGRIEDYAIGLPSPGVWKLRFNSDSVIYDDQLDQTRSSDLVAQQVSRDGQGYSASLSIGAYSCLIYSQDP